MVNSDEYEKLLFGCTRMELIALLMARRWVAPVSAQEIKALRWRALSKRAQAKMEAAAREMIECCGKDHCGWRQANQRFEQAQAAEAKARALFEELRYMTDQAVKEAVNGAGDGRDGLYGP